MGLNVAQNIVHVAKYNHQQENAVTQLSTYAIGDIRRANLRRYVSEHGGPTAVAKMLGHSNGSFLVQMIGPNPTRPVTEKSARAFEAQLGLEHGTFDREVEVPAAPTAEPAKVPGTISPDDLVAMITSVRTACETEHVDLPTSKFADVLALAVKNANGPTVDDEYVRTLIRLLK